MALTEINRPDSVKSEFGTGNDLSIYHNGSNSYIDDTGTGDLFIRGSNDLYITNPDGTETKARFATDGAVYLYYDNSKKCETTNSGLRVYGNLDLEDNETIRLGNGDDFRLSHNGTNSFIVNDTGELQFQANDVRFYTSGASETHAKFIHNGAVELYHDNVKRFETVSDGVKVTAPEGGIAHLYIHGDEGDDNADQYRIRVPNNDGFYIQAGSGNENALKLDVNAGVYLYYDNVLKVETEPKGIKVNSGGSGEGLVQIIGANSSSSTIEFGDTDDDDVCQIWYDHYGKSLNLRTSEDAEINFFENSTKVLQTCSEGIRVMEEKIYLGGGSDGAIIKGGMSVSASAGWVTIFTIPTTCQVMLFTTASHNAGFSSACWDVSHSNSGGNSTEEEHKNNAYSPSSINVRIDGNNVQVDVSYDIWGSFVGIVTYGAGGIGNIT